MSEEKKKGKAKKPDKYDITVKVDSTFEEAMKKIATHPNKKTKDKPQTP